MLIIFGVNIFTVEVAVITYLCSSTEFNGIYSVYLLPLESKKCETFLNSFCLSQLTLKWCLNIAF